MNLIFSTDKPAPKKQEKSWYAYFYRKHEFDTIFDSYKFWGPVSLEIHCHKPWLSRNMVVNCAYYLSIDGQELPEKEKMSIKDLQMLCTVFDLKLKDSKYSK